MEPTFNQKGMTLIEVLLSLAILVLLATYFLTAITTSNTWISRAGKSSQGINLASAIMEDIRANVNSVNVGIYSDSMLNVGLKNGGLNLSRDYSDFPLGKKFAIQVIIKEVYLKDGVVTEIEPHMSTDLLQVLVQVAGLENNHDHTEELTAVMSRR